MAEGTLSGQVALVADGTRGLGKEFVRAQLEVCIEPNAPRWRSHA
ncbi:MAG: hypothetical protein ACJ72A_03970 [Nocardioidaceae bacterium]|jgi:hypothetical protein